MRKTTVYLPDETKARLERMAVSTGRSEADLIREALVALTSGAHRPRPRASLFSSGTGGLAERVDELLEGFGER
jgi:Arc/MetJ-type ribon-helix-helix transcriptional regulator